MVGHTRASKSLVDSAANDWLGIATEEMAPAAGKVSLPMLKICLFTLAEVVN